MPELIRLQTPDFEFSVWANDISARAKVYQATVAERASLTLEYAESDAALRFAPEVELVDIAVIDEQNSSLELDNSHAQTVLATSVTAPEKCSTFTLNTPLFFENTQYQFEWVFLQAVSDAYLVSGYAKVIELLFP
ncbi:hypothetical protein [Halomonas sp. 3A7M]|uniref:hypothetical protein n=1 Tax=Halomonas sp. 3A7M TaxID=2742616 RepID=UPI00186728EF|nr:hypothetical protein [Halomonas sp. 3A7M]